MHTHLTRWHPFREMEGFFDQYARAMHRAMLRHEERSAMAEIADWAPTVDVRKMIPKRYVDTLFLNNTDAIKGLYQFDAPSSPEKWERIWSDVEAS